jgi:tRNA A-37 threonylcarbamoyl transferase component Bud32
MVYVDIDGFNFASGRIVARKYEVIKRLGGGWEAEVYLIKELSTGIERAAKFFFPKRNLKNKASNFYAKKLHKLRDCPGLIQYHTQETIQFKGMDVTFLVSDFVEGEVLVDYLKGQRGKRLDPFHGLHLLHSICCVIRGIHRHKDYHGDLHTGNVIIKRRGLGFDVKLLDFFHWGSPKPENLKDDICDAIHVLYDSMGGKTHYAKHPKVIKDICCGLKRTLILKKFRNINTLIDHIENITWD